MHNPSQLFWPKIVVTILVLLLTFIVYPISTLAAPSYQSDLVVMQSGISTGKFNLSSHYQTIAFLRWLFPEKIKEEGRPARTESAGRRGKCSSVSAFTGIVPSVDKPLEQADTSIPPTELKSSVGLTTQEFPKLWFYLPTLPEGVDSAELMIQSIQNQGEANEDEIDIVRKPIFISLPEEPGILGISLKGLEMSLEFGKLYHWYLSIICDSEQPSRNPSVDAWIKRVQLSPSLESQLSHFKEEPRKQLELYVEDGIWHDAFTLIAKLRCQYPEDGQLLQGWMNLLKDIGKDEESLQAPIICSSFG